MSDKRLSQRALRELGISADAPRTDPQSTVPVEPPETVFYRADRALAVPHREDDQPCGCDECMAYGAEDEGADWYRLAPARRIVIRALDSGDDRLAPLAIAFREHEAADHEAALADLRDAVEIMDQKITPYGERDEDGTTLAYIVADSTWHRVLAVARGSTSDAARRAIDDFRVSHSARPGPGWGASKEVVE